MRPLALDEILDPERYEALRTDFRAAVIAHKRRRRLAVGEKVTLVFEDRETLRFQVQEMLRVERIRDPALVQQELDVYNELIPGANELSATLFVEITDSSEIRNELDRLIGIDEHVALVLGEEDDEQTVHASFDPKQMEEDRISAVQYIRFRLEPAAAERFGDPDVTARIRIGHPQYRREVEIPPAVRRSLVADLTRDPEPLFPRVAVGRPSESDPELLFVRGRVRVSRASESHGPGHVIVEAEPPAPLLGTDATLHAEVLALVLELARELTERHGGCRIRADAEGRGARLRWHVYAAPR